MEGRYKAKLVQGDEYLMTLTRYIHLNPVQVKALRNQGKGELKRYLDAYRWSSYGGYREKRRCEEFVSYDVLKTLDSDAQPIERADATGDRRVLWRSQLTGRKRGAKTSEGAGGA